MIPFTIIYVRSRGLISRAGMTQGERRMKALKVNKMHGKMGRERETDKRYIKAISRCLNNVNRLMLAVQ